MLHIPRVSAPSASGLNRSSSFCRTIHSHASENPRVANMLRPICHIGFHRLTKTAKDDIGLY